MVRVRQSTIIDAPCDEVWRVLRDFNGHADWHPAIAASEIEDRRPADAIGAVRHFRLRDGGELREQLLAISDKERALSYCLLEAPLPLMGYVASIRLKPVTDCNRTFWEWSCEFHPPVDRREELTRIVRDDIYRAGFAAIQTLLSDRSAGAPERTSVPQPPPAPVLPAIASKAAGLVAASRTRAIVVDRYGGPEVLQMQEIDLPAPTAGEVHLRHSFIGVNYIDVYCRTGYFDLLRPPGIPGMEAAGVVESIGPDVHGFSVGDRVAYACPPVGAYCERRNITPELLLRLPDDIPDDLAAAGLLKGITASFLLHDVHRVRPGSSVLIHAAAGGVGQILVQWARHLGASVIATVSTDDKAEIVRRLGADHVIVHRRSDFAAEVMRLTGGRGVDAAYDAIGRDSFARTIAALAARGHIISFGQASGPVGEWDIGALSSKSITISRPNFGHYTDTPEKLATHADRLFAAIRHGIVSIAPPRRYPLHQAAQAHRDLEARATTGSLVLTP